MSDTTHARSGFTLLEMIVASIVLGVLMAAMGSVVALSTRALPDRQDSVGPSVVAADVLHQLATDLGEATKILRHDERGIELRVPDRTGDGEPETVQYRWSGVAGEPLLRAMNDERPLVLVRAVDSFDLGYSRSKHSIALDGELVESARAPLAGLESASSAGNRSVDEDVWFGQHFTPNIPDEAERWSIHRIDLRISSSGPANGHAWLRIREATSDGLPGGAVLAEALIVEEELSSNIEWRQFEILGTQRMHPSVQPVLTIEHIDDSNSCTLRIATPDALPIGMHLLETEDGGSTWTKDEDQSLFFRVIGTYSVRGPTQTLGQEYIERVRVRLVPIGWEAGAFETAVRVPGGVRIAELDADEDDEDEAEDGA